MIGRLLQLLRPRRREEPKPEPWFGEPPGDPNQAADPLLWRRGLGRPGDYLLRPPRKPK